MIPDITLHYNLFGWESLCFICALIGFFIALLVHMASEAMGLPNLKMWAKSEYMQVAASFLIILLAIGMANVGMKIGADMATEIAKASNNAVLANASANVSNADDPVKIAKSYLINGPLTCEVHLYELVRAINRAIEGLNSLSINLSNVEGVGLGFFYAGKVSATHYAAQSIAYLSIFHYIQYHLLDFSQYVMLQIFLPIGIILRTFAPTRGAGGLMIAFALGFAFIFPISYLFILAIMPQNSLTCGDKFVAQANAASPQAAYANEFLSDDPCANNAGSTVMKMMKSEGDAGEQSEIMQILSLLNQMYLQAIFYPMVCLILTFTFVRQTSSLFGTDLAEIGRGLIKII